LLESENIVPGSKQKGHMMIEFDHEFNVINQVMYEEPAKVLALKTNQS